MIGIKVILAFTILLYIDSLSINTISRNKMLPGALASEHEIRGNVTIGAGTLVDPSASILAEAGPIIIGTGNIIEAQAKIIHRIPCDQGKETTPVLTIGKGNIFKASSQVEACRVGGGNIFKPNCFVGNKVTVTDGCIIEAGCRLTNEQTIPKGLIVTC